MLTAQRKRNRKSSKDGVISQALSLLPKSQQNEKGARKFLRSKGFPLNMNHWICWEVIIGYHSLSSVELNGGRLLNPAKQISFVIKFYQTRYGSTPTYSDLVSLWGDTHEGDLDDNFSEWYEKAYQHQLAA